MGRMHAETCHVNRQRFVDMQAYDLISGLDGMDEPSPTRGDRRVRIRENIAEGMLEDYVMTEEAGTTCVRGISPISRITNWMDSGRCCRSGWRRINPISSGGRAVLSGHFWRMSSAGTGDITRIPRCTRISPVR